MSNNGLMRITQKITVDGDIEYDYLDSASNSMRLSTVDTLKITSALVGRPDLMSFRAFNSYDFIDLLLKHNDIIDPYEEIKIGDILNVPSLEEYYRFINRNRKK